nr:hypothetical protein [Tanacetum cinerariifolium]
APPRHRPRRRALPNRVRCPRGRRGCPHRRPALHARAAGRAGRPRHCHRPRDPARGGGHLSAGEGRHDGRPPHARRAYYCAGQPIAAIAG